jgi:alpha-mannosidase
VLTSATEGIAADLDTRSEGAAIVVYNPLNIEREDVVEATVSVPFETVRVVGPDGREVPAQLSKRGNETKVLFLARVPSVGYAVYGL